MRTDLGDALSKAISNKKNDINSFVWKCQNGKEVRLMDCSESDLQKYYIHCMDMLYNRNIYNPGKYVVRENINKTFINCNTELFRRYLLYECEIDSLKINKDIIDFINLRREGAQAENNPISLDDSITTLFSNLDPSFEKITVGKLLDACFDKLDILNRKMISDKFILSQGIWLTESEKEDLTEYDEENKLRNRLDVIKERLLLDPNVRLRVDSNGLSFSELRSLVKLDQLPKISSLPTPTLKTLRDKILLLLDNDLNYHIDKWTTLKENIEKVANYKKIELVCKKEY